MEQKSYYAIIPATVRYDRNLPDGAKLLYGEITALCNQQGFCWASNQYFSELYGKSKNTIGRWVTLLEDCGYIIRNIRYKEGSKEVDARCITICDSPIKSAGDLPLEMEPPSPQWGDPPLNLKVPSPQKSCDPPSKNGVDNTTVNTTLNNTKKYIKGKFEKPTVNEIRAYCTERGNSIDAEYFWNFYESKNWMVGKNKMSNWKSCVVTWEKNNQDRGKPQNQPTQKSFSEIIAERVGT